jgi:DHA2 family multidrug resistance protein
MWRAAVSSFARVAVVRRCWRVSVSAGADRGGVGGSIGIALITTFVSRQTQKHQTFLASHSSSANQQFQAAVSGLTQMMAQKGFDPVTASNHAWAQMQAMIQAHSANLAYVDVVSVLALVVACLVPLPFFMKRGLPVPGAPMGH